MKYNTKHDGSSITSDADLLAPIPNFAMIKKQDDRLLFWNMVELQVEEILSMDEVPAMKALECFNCY